MRIGIFCSSKSNIDPDFFKETEKLGKWIGKNKHSIVYGGSDMGLMECIAKAVHESGGTTIGIIPSKLEDKGDVSTYVDVEFPCDNLGERKELMMTQSDVFIALPGGIGTADEIFTVMASATIGYNKKKVILYNMKGFWNPLISLLDHFIDTNMVNGSYDKLVTVAKNLKEIEEELCL